MKDELLTIETPEEELESKLLAETDIDNVKNIINLFNLSIKKKDIIRTAKLNDLQDKVYNQIDKRLTLKADEFSNSDLLSYFKVIQETINKADTTLNKVDTPSIQITQNQLNINSSEEPLTRESKEKISNLVKKFIQMSEEPNVVDTTYVEEDEEDEEYEQLTLKFDEEN